MYMYMHNIHDPVQLPEIHLKSAWLKCQLFKNAVTYELYVHVCYRMETENKAKQTVHMAIMPYNSYGVNTYTVCINFCFSAVFRSATMTSINDCSDEDVPEIALVFENGRGSVLEASSSVSPIPPEDGPTHTEADTLSFQKEPSSLNATGMTVHSEENAVNETCDPGALAESDSQEISSQPSPFDPNVQYDNGGLDNGSVIEVTNSSLGHQETSEIQNGHSPSHEDSGDTCTPRNQTGNARDSSLAEERNGGVQDEVTEVPSNSEVPVSQSVSSSHSEPQASQENHSTGSEPIEAVSSEDQDVDGCPNESNLDASNLDAGIRVRPTGSQVGDLPVLQPLSPTHGSDLNEQYEYLRRTLSHSRRRYSTRRRNNHGSHSASQRQPRHTEGSHQRELEPRELTRARSEIHQTRQQQTIGQLRDILRNSGDSGTRLSGKMHACAN